MKVSVVIPVFQAAAFVEQAVLSALDQSETGEVILIEDGSPDGSLAACRRLAEQHASVRLFRHPGGQNRGAGASRNLGIEKSTCPLVAFLDADDLYRPGRFSAALEILSARPDVDGVYETIELFTEDEEARRRGLETGWPERMGVRRNVAPEDLFETLVAGGAGAFHTDGIVVRRGLFDRSGRFDPRFRTAQDTHLWIRMAAVGRLVSGPAGRVVARCRIHGGNRVTGQPRRDHVAGVRQVWADLMRWGRANGLSSRRIQLLGRRYVAASRGMLLRQPMLRAWRTGLETLGCLARICPAPWRVNGFRDVLLEASGFGLAVQRAADWMVHGSGREAKGKSGVSSMALVIVWFGPWPFWMPAFLLSCAKNPTVDWLIFSDAPPPADLPDNVKILPMEMETFNRRATQALGFEVKILPSYAYKLCDLKILYGRVFAAELHGYDFWGCCDMDVVWGDIRRFLAPEVLARYDVITSRPGRISGHFCLFRNRPEWADLFRRIPDVAELAQDSEHYRRIDEDGLTDLLQGYQKRVLRRLWVRQAKGLPVPRVYWERLLAPNGRRQRRMLEDPSLSMCWRNGRVVDADGEEMMYLHFHSIRKSMQGIDFDSGDLPKEFTITPTGFAAVRESVR